MVPPILIFYSISRIESLESQQKHALKNNFLRALLCLNDNLNPGCNQIILIRKNAPLLDEGYLNYEQLFHPVQCTACKLCQCCSIDNFVLSKMIGILSTSGQPHCL